MNKKQIEQFLDVLATEISTITDANCEISIKETKVSLKIKEYEASVAFNTELNTSNFSDSIGYKEQGDCINGFVRLRFETVRFLLPDNF